MFPIGDDNSSRRTVPLVTYALIALNVLFFFVELTGGNAFIEKWAFVPSRFLTNPIGESLTLFTSMFMHAGWVHLGGNMLYLWIFGDDVELNDFSGSLLMWTEAGSFSAIVLELGGQGVFTSLPVTPVVGP